MAKKISISEQQLVKVIKKMIGEQIEDDEVIVGVDDEELEFEDEEEEEELEQILSPDEIVGLMEDQILQLQDRVQYLEELQADVLEFTEYLMNDLEKTDVAPALRKSKQKLRALQGRAGREIFWLKARRL